MRRLVLALLMLVTGCAQPGARVRVAFDTQQITSATVSGLADRTTKRRVTADDPVRVASVSKLIVALGVMRLVEAGKLDLDRDVSGYLGWSLRNPALADRSITLRMLLSHTAGVRDGVDYAIPLGGSMKATLADAKGWDAGHPPGGYFTYSNLNFGVIATVMEAATHERFDFLMARTVFVPLGLDACFNWTSCSDDAVARAIVLYDANGSVRKDDLRGRRAPCPVLTSGDCDLGIWAYGVNGSLFSPQGGARISANDLAKIGQLLLNDGMAGGTAFLSPASMRILTTPVWTYDGHNGDIESGFFCRYALAVQTLATSGEGCRDDLFGDGHARIGHAGEAYGLRSGLWIDRVAGRGVAFFATAVPDKARKGRRSAFTHVEEVLATTQPHTPRRSH